jgi:hypothetical protein
MWKKFQYFCFMVLLGFQAVLLDYILFTYGALSESVLTIFIAVAEVPLALHMCGTILSRMRDMKNTCCVQWTMYSWTLAGKVFVFYVKISASRMMRQSWDLLGVSSVNLTLMLTPIIYAIAMGVVWQEPDKRKTQGTSVHFTAADMTQLLMSDMVWHVFLDFVDIIQMFRSMVERQDLNQFTSSTGETAVGVFIFLGLFFHAQSVPGVDVLSQRKYLEEVTDEGQGSMTWMDMMFYTKAVFQARRRSAVVSIFLVDVPFLITRCWVYIRMVQNGANIQVMEDGIEMDMWSLKNLLMIVLQSMHLGLHNGDVLTSRADEFRSKVIPGSYTQKPSKEEATPSPAAEPDVSGSSADPPAPRLDISVSESLATQRGRRPSNLAPLNSSVRGVNGSGEKRIWLSDLRNRFRRKKLETVPADAPAEASDSGDSEEWDGKDQGRGGVTDQAEVVADRIWRVGILYQVLVFCVGLSSGILVSSSSTIGGFSPEAIT